MRESVEEADPSVWAQVEFERAKKMQKSIVTFDMQILLIRKRKHT
jgi:hypothetical protein